MQWRGEASTNNGVVEREFRLEVAGRTVPAVVWTPEGSTGPRPLVLLGHGAATHKKTDYIAALGSRLVRHHGFAAAAIDATGHGDRLPDGGKDRERIWAERIASRSNGEFKDFTDDMVADWKATLDAVQTLPEVGDSLPVGYWGLSMGTSLGLPFVAAEPRITVAVFGLMGFATGPSDNPWMERGRIRLGGDAPKITVPVLFIQQWDDELVSRENGLNLFNAIASKDKRLHINPGAHAAVPVEEFDHSEALFVKHLGVVKL